MISSTKKSHDYFTEGKTYDFKIALTKTISCFFPNAGRTMIWFYSEKTEYDFSPIFKKPDQVFFQTMDLESGFQGK